jgi:hypothetical protein
MQHCPSCKSEAIHRSRTRNRWEQFRRELSGKRPYRCRECGWRGWGVDTGPRFTSDELETAQGALAPDPPNLSGTSFARREPPQLDIAALDMNFNDEKNRPGNV